MTRDLQLKIFKATGIIDSYSRVNASELFVYRLRSKVYSSIVGRILITTKEVN